MKALQAQLATSKKEAQAAKDQLVRPHRSTLSAVLHTVHHGIGCSLTQTKTQNEVKKSEERELALAEEVDQLAA